MDPCRIVCDSQTMGKVNHLAKGHRLRKVGHIDILGHTKMPGMFLENI